MRCEQFGRQIAQRLSHRNLHLQFGVLDLGDHSGRVTNDGNLVGLQVPRTCEAASWEPNDVYDELGHAGFSGCSEEDQEETFNRFLKPAAPPASGNGVVVPHEAPDGPPKPKKKGKK